MVKPRIPPPPPLKWAWRRKAYRQLVAETAGLELGPVDGPRLEALVAATSRALPTVDPEVVAATAANITLGHALTEAGRRLYCERLAGNLGTLQRGVLLPARPRLQQAGWVFVRVVDVTTQSRWDGQDGLAVWLRALTGPGCGLTLVRTVSRRAWPLLARQLGSFRLEGLPAARIPEDLINLLCWAYCLPRPDAPLAPQILSYAHNAMMQTHNRQVLRLRRRALPCPRGYRHACHECPVGYAGPSSCVAAMQADPVPMEPEESADAADDQGPEGGPLP